MENTEYKAKVLSCIKENESLSISEIQQRTKIFHYKLVKILDELVSENKIKKQPIKIKRFKFMLEGNLPKTSEKEENTNQATQPTENIKKEDTDLKNSLESPQTQTEEKENGTQSSTQI